MTLSPKEAAYNRQAQLIFAEKKRMDESIQTWDSPTTSSSRLLTKPKGSSSSRLTLVLPPLKSLKDANKAASTKKGKHRADDPQPTPLLDIDVQEKRAPRPLKLKPLKEVLSKLIHQIKRKDDYAFFLKPVDASQVPGYTDIIKQPMDFGTMTKKVEKGSIAPWKSLLSNDFRLVITNAKIFNPAGSIYYTEAERIEAWGMDHIAKAAPTVIQSDAVCYGGGCALPRRSASVVSQTQQQHTGRRGPRGPYKRHTIPGGSQLSEMLDADGGLPGSKDGLGAFPSGSDWAKMMLALKLKGKRYRTKKERLRFEKEGPPYLPDGSLDYTESTGGPFSVLSALAPDPLTRPYLTPLYPPPATAASGSSYATPTTTHPTFYSYQPPSTVQSLIIPSQPPSAYPPQTPISTSTYPTPTPEPTGPLQPASSINAVTLPLNHPIPSVGPIPEIQNSKRRHWYIVRNTNARLKGRDRTRREKGMCLIGAREKPGCWIGEVWRGGKQVEVVRESLKVDKMREKAEEMRKVKGKGKEVGYWTDERALEAEEYIRDVVYGGVDGFAYIRSLAEFTYDPRREYDSYSLGMPLARWVEKNVVDPLTDGRHSLLRETALALSRLKLTTPPSTSTLLQIKQEHSNSLVIDQLLKSLHIYPAASLALNVLLQIKTHKIDMAALIKRPEELFVSEEEWAGKGIKEKRKRKREPSEEAVDRKKMKESESRNDGEVKVEEIEGGVSGESAVDQVPLVAAQPETQNALAQEEEEEEEEEKKTALETEESEKTWMDASLTQSASPAVGCELEGPEELSEVLDYVAGVIMELDRRIRSGRRVGVGEDAVMVGATLPKEDTHTKATAGGSSQVSSETSQTTSEPQPQSEAHLNGTAAIPTGSPVEDPTLRNLRLNLLALAKRAPLDTIARLPEDLVPEHIRNFVPTLGSSSSN
ncbi:hypothetical protein BDQ17DRAFT_1426149 [Cyathus striatus]|nr:hypothetical protein BDQ17DRAFT_1426149 [Cyathus striatus]